MAHWTGLDVGDNATLNLNVYFSAHVLQLPQWL